MSRSVERALAILSLFDRNKQEWGITEISRELDLPKSTVHGLVKTLADKEFLNLAKSGKYRLDKKVFELGLAYSSNMEITSAAEPYVRLLADRSRQAVHMAIYANRAAVFIMSTDVDQRKVMFPRVGTGVAAYCTSVGKVLLAWQSPQHIENFLDNEDLLAMTRNTIIDPERLRMELEKIKEQGYAFDSGEALLDTACIAAPIFGSTGQIIAAISISGPIDSIMEEQTLASAIRNVVEAGQNISKVMGYI